MSTPNPFFETPRLLFRPFAESDLGALAALVSDRDVVRYVSDGQPLSRDDTSKWITASRRNVLQHGFGTGAIVGRRTGQLIGWGGLSRPPGSPPEIIYGLGKDHWGRGLGTEFVTQLAAYLRDVLGMSELRATVHPDNVASGHILSRLGFRMVEEQTFEDGTRSLLFVLSSPR
jgi:ribosomal-protein-alanine N-acetyltransferase